MQNPFNMNTAEATEGPDRLLLHGTHNYDCRFHGPSRNNSISNRWIDLSLSMLEAQQVIFLRTMRLAEDDK
jgi:hypothetical protein